MGATGEVEIASLQATVRALRDELERAHDDAEAREQQARAELHAEVTQLHDTVAALRAELERQRADAEAAARAAERDTRAETDQLRAAIVAARELADDREQRRVKDVAAAEAAFAVERRDLIETIKRLRHELSRTETAAPEAAT